MCKVILRLLHEPAFFGAEELGQPDGHFRRYAALSVDKFRKRVARYSRASAASVIVRRIGSMHSCNTTRPGCVDFFIFMGCFLSVVIDIIDVFDLALVKTENHSPVRANGHAVETL